MHYLKTVMSDVDSTHPKLGKLTVMAMLTIKAHKLLLVVSPRGCGKSRVSSFVGQSHPEPMVMDRISVAGLASLREKFTDFTGVLVVDDIAKTQTRYARITTMTTLAELIYSHYCVSHLAGMHFEITEFCGSGIINVQPILLKELVSSSEWEASMQDKTIRYYHIYRPTNPNPEPPKLKLEWGIDFSQVETPKLTGKLSHALLRLAEVQWGLARLKEHIIDLLKAAAALDKREKVTQADYKLLLDVMQPLRIEGLVLDKKELETDRYFDSNKLAILTEFLTYGQFTLRQVSRDYKLSESQCYRILNNYFKDWRVVAKEPTTYAPSDEFLRRLKDEGIV